MINTKHDHDWYWVCPICAMHCNVDGCTKEPGHNGDHSTK